MRSLTNLFYDSCNTNHCSTVWLGETSIDRPTSKDFTKGRKKKDIYTTFFLLFVPAVVGPEIYRSRLQESEETCPPKALCTTSDEVFALLLLENSYDHWLDIYTRNGGIPKQRRGDRSRKIDSEIEPKYTKGGLKYSAEDKISKTKGWTPEGIKRYNELFLLVKTDRLKRPTFMKKFKEEQKLAINRTRKKQKRTSVKAVHSMWEDQQTNTVAPTGSDNAETDNDTDSGEGETSI